MKKVKINLVAILIVLMATLAFMGCPATIQIIPPPIGPLGPDPVVLATAENYVILAKTAISTVPLSAITGEVALSPAGTAAITGFSLTSFTGYATSAQVTGRLYSATMAAPVPANLTASVLDMEAAYLDAESRTNADFTDLGTGIIGGLTFAPGLYNWTGVVTMPSSITISGKASDTWIFQIAGTLDISASVEIILTGGALAKNIVWQVADAVTIGSDAKFEGIILGKTGISMGANATLNGRMYAQTAITLDQNTILQPAE